MSFDFTKLRNIGPACAKDFVAMGIKDFDEMKQLGTEELLFRRFQHFSNPKKICTCWARAVEGAITDTRWNEIPDDRLAQIKKYAQNLKNSF